MAFSATEISLLRSLAAQVRELTDSSAMADLRRRWTDHNDLVAGPPIIMVSPEGAWQECLPETDLKCVEPSARQLERGLRKRLYQRQVLKDDTAFDPWYSIGWSVRRGDVGVAVPKHRVEARGSYHWEPPLKNLAVDLAQLRRSSPTVDRAATAAALEETTNAIGDILPCRVTGYHGWSMGLTNIAIDLVGLEELMFAMMDSPAAVHQLMAFLRDDWMSYISWFEKEGLYSPHNQDNYVGSGGLGYTRQLPRPGWKPGDDITTMDVWGFAESQETVGVSPAMFEEFILPYQLPLLERFGLNCYGCCEPVDQRLGGILRIPRLRRLSVAPWANQEVCAEALGRKIIFSRKPNPSPVCAGFDEAAIRADLASTFAAARGCQLEVILKDTHTVENQPWRLARWVEIAREECARAWK